MREYFNVYFDETGVLHISPRDNIEAMALKHLLYEVGEHTMERMISIDTVIPMKLSKE